MELGNWLTETGGPPAYIRVHSRTFLCIRDGQIGGGLKPPAQRTADCAKSRTRAYSSQIESQDRRRHSGLTTKHRFHRVSEARSWCFVALIPVAIFAAFVICGAIGNAQTLDNRRVFGALDPVVDLIRVDGGLLVRWLFDHAVVVGSLVFGVAVLVGLAGIASTRRLSSPLLLACAGVGFVAWGQVCIVEERFLLGTCLYGCGMACAFVLGRVCPISRLPGFPRCGGASQEQFSNSACDPDTAAELSPASTPVEEEKAPRGFVQSVKAVCRSAREKAGWLWLECLLVAALSILGMVLRMYGLTELPSGFDNEMVNAMAEARTWHGVKTFLETTFLGTSVGSAHVPTQFVSYRVFGTSIFAVRIASVFWGTLTIPLFYWLLRRIAGVLPAFIGTLLFIAAPEQLFWSRSENGQFAPMTFYAVVTGHLALWVGCRTTWPSALAAALWMPVGTFFYFPCVALTVLPALAWAHAVVFAHRGWRTARYVVPLLAVGVLMLCFGKSLLLYGVRDGVWAYHFPLVVHGNVAWKGQTDDIDSSVGSIFRNHIETAKTRIPQVARGWTYGDLNSTHWCQRTTYGPQPGPSINIAITALLALGAGFLLGQLRDSRAAVLLFWIVLGLAPGLLSSEASPRRIGLVFPVVLAIATIQLAVLWRVPRVVSGPRLAKVVGALCAFLAVVIAWTNLVSHFQLPIHPVVFTEIAEFIRPEVEASDTVFHTFDERIGASVFFHYLDPFIRDERPCIASLSDQNWPGAAVTPECRFDDSLLVNLFPPETLERFRDAYEQRNVSFIIHNRFGDGGYLDALSALYPDAVSKARYLPLGEFGEVCAIRVPAAAMSEKRNPLVVVEESADPSARTQLMGGFLIPSDGWYRFRVRPTEADVELRIDGRSAGGAPPQPMLTGMHALELEFPAKRKTQLPWEIEMLEDQTGVSRILKMSDLAHPSVALIPGIQAPPIARFDGFSAPRRVAAFAGRPSDLGVDKAGRLFVLLRDLDRYTVVRLGADGKVEEEWQPPVHDYDRACIAVDRDGRVVVVGRREMLVYSADGQLQFSAPFEFSEPVLDAVVMNDGRLLLSVDERNSLELFDGTGRHLDSLNDLGEDTPAIARPVGLAIDRANRVLVTELHGRALLFQAADNAWPPRLESVFDTGMRSPVDSRGCAFGGQQRLIIPNRNTRSARIFDRNGHRVVARISTRDLSTQPLDDPVAFARHEDTLYTIDGEFGCLMAIDIADLEETASDSGPAGEGRD